MRWPSCDAKSPPPLTSSPVCTYVVLPVSVDHCPQRASYNHVLSRLSSQSRISWARCRIQPSIFRWWWFETNLVVVVEWVVFEPPRWKVTRFGCLAIYTSFLLSPLYALGVGHSLHYDTARGHPARSYLRMKRIAPI
ncbi:hypothetical protein DFH08DRAFT_215117 [Mycena albidolilacea]|uniref:Uncharacterized protein n=1 Tax=Mycena albidolilacea TaxID=1033008 RepID=A0AAD6ZY56_9AGAR|nr:hypothetical protein DFH08DRAFT_215117 [Mycena albidolilacea]